MVGVSGRPRAKGVSAIAALAMSVAVVSACSSNGTTDAQARPETGDSTSAVGAPSTSGATGTESGAAGGGTPAKGTTSVPPADSPSVGPTSPQPSSSPTSSPDPSGDDPTGPTPTASPTDLGGNEVLPPSPSPSGLPGLDDNPSDRGPLVHAPLPKAASAHGHLVKGYPKALRPVKGTAIVATSVSPSGPRLQVSLEGTTKASAQAVQTAYRTKLLARGFRERALPAVGGSTAIAFTRGPNRITLTTTPGSRTGYVLFATLRVAG